MKQAKSTLKIGLVELYADSVIHRIAIRFPSRALDLMQAILLQNGFSQVTTYNPMFDGHRGRVTKEDILRLASLDVVGFSAISSTQNISYELAAKLKSINPRLHIVFGGYHTSCMPEETLQYADTAVLNEGDYTIVELMERIAEHREQPMLDDVNGIAFKSRDGLFRRTPPRPFLTCEQLDALPFPVVPERALKKINCHKVITSRGCPHECNFCTISTQFGKGTRSLSVERSVEAIEHAIREYDRLLLMADDNFGQDPARAKAVLERLLQKGVKMPKWSVSARVETAFDTDLLKLMKQTNCRKVFIGLENMTDEGLQALKKNSSFAKNVEAIRRFQNAGLLVHGHFVFGSESDTVKTVETTARYIRQMKFDTAFFFFLTPGPSSKLSEQYQKSNRLISQNWRRYDGNSICIYPPKIRPSELKKAVDRAYLQVYSPLEAIRYLFRRKVKSTTLVARTLGFPAILYLIARDRPYVAELVKLEKWVEAFDCALEKQKELSKTSANLANADFLQKWKESAAHLSADFKEFVERRVELAGHALAKL